MPKLTKEETLERLAIVNSVINKLGLNTLDVHSYATALDLIDQGPTPTDLAHKNLAAALDDPSGIEDFWMDVIGFIEQITLMESPHVLTG